MRKAFYNIRSVVYFIFLVFPILTALVLSISVFFRTNNPEAVQWYNWPGFGTDIDSAFSCVAVTLLLLCLGYMAEKNKVKVLWVILLLSMALKLAAVFAFWKALQPTSDTLYSWMIANRLPGYEEKLTCWHAYYSTWANWGALLRKMVVAFPQYGWYVLFSTIFNCISCLLIYAIGKKVFKTQAVALLTACVYSWYVPQFFYNLWNVPDTVALTFFLLAGLFLCEKKNCNILLAGLALGIGNCLKPIAPVFVVALFIVFFYEAIEDRKNIKYNAIAWIMALLMMVCVPKIAQTASENILETKISDSPAADFLCIGLRTDGEGQLGIGENSMLYINLRNEGYSEQDASDAVFSYLKNDWEVHRSSIPRLIIKKIEWAWQDDFKPFSSLMSGKIDSHYLNSVQQMWLSFIGKTGAVASQSNYCLLLIFSLVGGVAAYKDKLYENPKMFFIWVFIIGYSLLLMISEAQSRYKSNAIPMICAFSSLGIENFWRLFENKLNGHSKI